MTSKIYSFLKQHNISTPDLVDALIISAYVKFNNLIVKKNRLILTHIINENKKALQEVLTEFLQIITEEVQSFNYEELIQLFEFVISPADKITNGAVYTPEYIRNYIITKTIKSVEKPAKSIKACDISCGCGGFLLSLAQQIKKITGLPLKTIFKENIYGLDITNYSIERAKLLLSIYAIEQGEDDNFSFNLKLANSLSFNWKKNYPEIKANDGFDVIVGNPPYVSSRNMDETTLALVEKWDVSASGHPDMYIPFFQIGFENINAKGTLGYITVNTFFKSLNGRALREYFHTNHVKLRIINFGGEQVFKDKITYTCICFLSHKGDNVEYLKSTSNSLPTIDDADFNIYPYKTLNHHDGWNLVNSNRLSQLISTVESVGTPFKDLYTTRNGIATLKNDVYKFTPSRSDRRYYYFLDDKKEIAIEQSICKDIVNANKIKSPEDIKLLKEKIIFPYSNVEGKLVIIPENIFQRNYPQAYAYLKTKRSILATRDKGDVDGYEAWYAYGRRQSMDINAYKLFFPHICSTPQFVLCRERELLFYNGLAVVSDRLRDLRILKKILESRLFFEYIKNTTKDYASGYISLSRNYIKNFGIPELSEEQERQILEASDSNELLEEIYGINNFQETV